jgi:hypothetical protein
MVGNREQSIFNSPPIFLLYNALFFPVACSLRHLLLFVLCLLLILINHLTGELGVVRVTSDPLIFICPSRQSNDSQAHFTWTPSLPTTLVTGLPRFCTRLKSTSSLSGERHLMPWDLSGFPALVSTHVIFLIFRCRGRRIYDELNNQQRGGVTDDQRPRRVYVPGG